MHYENNDKVFTILKNGGLSFGRVKLAREKITKIPSDSSTFHLFQVIWDDYRKMWQWLEEVETPLILYDRDFEVGDRVIYGNGIKGTVQKVIETATLLTDSETVIDDVKIKDIKCITTIYPSAMIEYQGWIGEVISVTREILCQCSDGLQFTFQSNEPKIISPKKEKKTVKSYESSKSRIEKLRVYPFHQENIKYFPGNLATFSKKELKRATWLTRSSFSPLKSFKMYRKYTRKPVTILSITITNIEVFWTGYIPFMLESGSAEKLSHISPTIDGPGLANVHPIKPQELSSLDCKDFINFGYGSYFQYIPKESDTHLELKNWEFQFKTKFVQMHEENSTGELDHNKNEINPSSGHHRHKISNNAIRVKKISSSRCYEVKVKWGEDTDTPAVIIPGWKLANDKMYLKVSAFKMGYPFVTKKFLFPDYEKLGVLFQKCNPDEDQLKSAYVIWGTITPAGTIKTADSSRESPYDLTYAVPPCLTMCGSILYNSEEEDTKFKYGVITQFDILEFGKVNVYDPIRGHSVKDISKLRSVHRLDSIRNCMYWNSPFIFKDTTNETGDKFYRNRRSQHLSIMITDISDFKIYDVANGSKYYEIEENSMNYYMNCHSYYYDLDYLNQYEEDKLKWQARVELEKQRFLTELPNGIWVCGFKNRTDLLTVVIEGNAGSILEDILIILEIKICSTFPKMSECGGVPYKIHFPNFEGSLLAPQRRSSEYVPNLSCNVSSAFTVGWSVLSTWDPCSSTLVDLLTSIKDKFQDHLFKCVSEPGRMELNHNGLKTEYAICQKYNFLLAIELLDSIGVSINYNFPFPNPWLYYFIPKYYSQAIIRIKNRYDEWITRDHTWLQENANSEKIPKFPFLPLSKDFSSSVMDRLIYYREILIEGKKFHQTTLYVGKCDYNENRGYKDLADGILEYTKKDGPLTTETSTQTDDETNETV